MSYETHLSFQNFENIFISQIVGFEFVVVSCPFYAEKLVIGTQSVNKHS